MLTLRSASNISRRSDPIRSESIALLAYDLCFTRGCLKKVKSGGHTSNPGFSSTPGVQIALYSFSGVAYDASAQTATIGVGLIWDDVYTELEQYGVTVVGPKSPGVGIGGVVLGGGRFYPVIERCR